MIKATSVHLKKIIIGGRGGEGRQPINMIAMTTKCQIHAKDFIYCN